MRHLYVLKVLSSILGHTNVAFTMDTYVHPLESQKQAAMQLTDNFYKFDYDTEEKDKTSENEEKESTGNNDTELSENKK